MKAEKIIVEFDKSNFIVYAVSSKKQDKILELKLCSSILTTNDAYEILLEILNRIDWILEVES